MSMYDADDYQITPEVARLEKKLADMGNRRIPGTYEQQVQLAEKIAYLRTIEYAVHLGYPRLVRPVDRCIPRQEKQTPLRTAAAVLRRLLRAAK